MHFLRAVQLPGAAGPLDQGDVGGGFLAGGAAGQQFQEYPQFAEPGDDLFDPHYGHVDPGKGGGKTGVPFVLQDGDSAGPGQGEVGPADPQAGLKIFIPQEFPGHLGQLFRVIVKRHTQLFGKQRGYLLLGLVQGRGDDVGRPLPRQLDDEFSQVGFPDPDPGGLQVAVQVDLLSGHGLALDHHLDPLRLSQVPDIAAGLGPVRGAVHGNPQFPGGGREFLQVGVQVFDGFGLDFVSPGPQGLGLRQFPKGLGPVLAETPGGPGDGLLHGLILQGQGRLFLELFGSDVHNSWLRIFGQDFHQVFDLDRRLDPVQPGLNIHQAARVVAHHPLRPGSLDLLHLFPGDGLGDLGEAARKKPAEPAAGPGISISTSSRPLTWASSALGSW